MMEEIEHPVRRQSRDDNPETGSKPDRSGRCKHDKPNRFDDQARSAAQDCEKVIVGTDNDQDDWVESPVAVEPYDPRE